MTSTTLLKVIGTETDELRKQRQHVQNPPDCNATRILVTILFIYFNEGYCNNGNSRYILALAQ